MSVEFRTAFSLATLSLCFFGSLSSLIYEANERPSVLLLTLAPDSVFEETDRLLGMAVTMLESVVVVLLLLLSLFLAQAANIIAMLIIIHR
ncbi:MAG: hypothetical protein DSY94_02340 [SAR324 cluster bacterium]|uniref:Uncharacterized protein n=1 Tax=SAR324 cluster bacterium TaxID=2024889 RepID=A0A432GRL5_9DELT|nr:MAG: hypothetical protein DSY94_02340 [SAR324 cluster bacterium]